MRTHEHLTIEERWRRLEEADERERKLLEALTPLLPSLRAALASWEFSHSRAALVGHDLAPQVNVSLNATLPVEAIRALLKEK